ncbi:MAG: T9SS type A sorting domain-containing protein [candidate division Zixibacteria bacterium]|nr:T9SS type A sorting domain-containing protein [candidate division Zixibacteria bacterium]
MKIRTFLISMALMLAVIGVSGSTWAYSGAVAIDTIEAEAGDQVAIPIRLSNNNEPISAITIPLHTNNPNLSIDSVSFVGSIVPADFTPLVGPEGNLSDSVFITLIGGFGIIPVPSIDATEGILATLHGTISPSAPNGLISIDSIYSVDSFPDGNGGYVQMITQINAADVSGLTTYFPDFSCGGVIVTSPTAVDDNTKNSLPGSFILAQNYPNPFNPTTIIEYSVPTSSHVRLEVFNILGQNVATLVDSYHSSGSYTVDFDASKQSSGIYFYRLIHNEGSETRKMTLVK